MDADEAHQGAGTAPTDQDTNAAAQGADHFFTIALSKPIRHPVTQEMVGRLEVRDPGLAAARGVRIQVGPEGNGIGITFSLGVLPTLVAAGAGLGERGADQVRLRDMLSHMRALGDFFTGRGTAPAGEGPEGDDYVMCLTTPVQVDGQTRRRIRLSDPESGALHPLTVTASGEGTTIDVGEMLPRLIASAAGIGLEDAGRIALRDALRNLIPLIVFFGIATPPTGGARG